MADEEQPAESQGSNVGETQTPSGTGEAPSSQTGEGTTAAPSSTDANVVEQETGVSAVDSKLVDLNVQSPRPGSSF